MSDTPRTDAVCWKENGEHTAFETVELVLADYARQLERQNAELLAALKVAATEFNFIGRLDAEETLRAVITKVEAQ